MTTMTLHQRPARPCLDCGKGTRSGSRCSQCQRVRDQELDARRGTNTARGYDGAWRRLVRAKLREAPWCETCGHVGSVQNPLTGDHLIPLSKGGTTTYGNVRILCRVHNSQRGNRGFL